MAHLIDFSNNRANMAYTGVTPWHTLGQEVEKNSPLTVWASAGGFNFEAHKARALYSPSANSGHHDSGFVVLYRSDTHAPLGIVTNKYKPVQPLEVLEFYRDLVDSQNYSIETVGCLDGGKRIWALANVGTNFAVAGTVDRVKNYLLLSTSFDGKSATVAKFTSIRVVCNNTLTLALGRDSGAVSVSHSATFNPEKVKGQLGIETASKKLADFENEANLLASKGISHKEAVKFLCQVFAGVDVPDELSTRQGNIIKKVYGLFDGAGRGATLKSANGTTWGLLNSVTEYIDHEYGNNGNNRLRNAWFGQGDKLKLEAKNRLLSLAA